MSESWSIENTKFGSGVILRLPSKPSEMTLNFDQTSSLRLLTTSHWNDDTFCRPSPTSASAQNEDRLVIQSDQRGVTFRCHHHYLA